MVLFIEACAKRVKPSVSQVIQFASAAKAQTQNGLATIFHDIKPQWKKPLDAYLAELNGAEA